MHGQNICWHMHIVLLLLQHFDDDSADNETLLIVFHMIQTILDSWPADGSISLQYETQVRRTTASSLVLNECQSTESDSCARHHSLDGEYLGLQFEVTVVRPFVGVVDLQRSEHPEGLGVLSLQLLGHVETVDHLALPSFHSLSDAVEKLHLVWHKSSFLQLNVRANRSIENQLKWYSLQEESVTQDSPCGRSAFLMCKLRCLPSVCPGPAMCAWGQR